MAVTARHFNLPIDLQRLELQNAVIQNLSAAPIAKTGLFYYDLPTDTPGHFNSGGTFIPWDASKYPGGLPNSALANNIVTIGSTSVALGATIASITGLTSVTATSFIGALSGNASTATRLATAINLNISGVTATAASFDGSADATIAITSIPMSLISGAITATQFPALTGDVTTVAGSLATTITNGAVTNAKLANSSVTVGTTEIALGNSATSIVGLTGVTATTFTGALSGNADTATKLAAAVTIALSGGATGTATAFDGSGNITIPVTSIDLTAVTGSMTASHISDLATVVKAYTLDSFAAPVGNLNLNNNRITGLADAVATTDAVTLAQLTAATSTSAAGLTPHNAVRLLASSNITLSGAQTIDGTAVADGDRVVCIGQTDATQNLIYVASTTGAWTIADDSTQGNLKTGSMLLVTDGTSGKGSQWWVTTQGALTIGTTAITWSEYGLNDGRIFGNGLTTSGATVSVKPDTGIVVTPTGVAIDTTVVARKVMSAPFGDTTSTVFNIAHNLNSTAVKAVLYNISTNQEEECGVEIVDANNVSLSFANPPATNAYKAAIIG